MNGKHRPCEHGLQVVTGMLCMLALDLDTPKVSVAHEIAFYL